jgi:hypothetical protein
VTVGGRSRSMQLFPLATMSLGHWHSPRRLRVAGGLHTTGSTHLRPFCTNPGRQTQSVPAAFGISGERHSIGGTQRLPCCTVPFGQTH